MPAKPNVADELAGRLVQLVRDQRDQGGNAYPLRLSRLVTLAGPEIDPALLAKALKHKRFGEGILLAQKKNADTLLALKEDADRLAGSDQLLTDLMEQSCTRESPLVQETKLAKLIEAPLRPVFTSVLTQRLNDGTLPLDISTTIVKKKRHLFLTRMPPPPPPKTPEVALADALLLALETRAKESEFVPWTLSSLRAEVAKDVDDKLFKKALGNQALKPRLLSAGKDENAPIALVEHVDQLAASATLLEFALQAARQSNNQAIALGDLKKKVSKSLQDSFAASLRRLVEQRTPPMGTGILQIKNQPCFFFWSDVVGSRGPEQQLPERPSAPSAIPPSIEFASAFDQVFDSLNRQWGSHNLVSLVELRRALPVDRSTFDGGLRELRRSGRYSLSGAEGRHGLSNEEQEAAIHEGASMLLYVARRS